MARSITRSAPSLNYCIFSGNLGRDAKVSARGCTLNVAINNFLKDKDGELKTNTCWRNVFVKNPLAESIGKYLTKGKTIIVVGHMDTWLPKEEGGKPFDVIIADKVVLLDRPGAFADEEAKAGEEGREIIHSRHEPVDDGPIPDDDIPF